MNTVAPKLIIEQVSHGLFEFRWQFRVEDEEGRQVYEGERHVLKLDAMRDRDRMVRDYADSAPTTDPVIRAVRRGIYVTKDDNR